MPKFTRPENEGKFNVHWCYVIWIYVERVIFPAYKCILLHFLKDASKYCKYHNLFFKAAESWSLASFNVDPPYPFSAGVLLASLNNPYYGLICVQPSQIWRNSNFIYHDPVVSRWFQTHFIGTQCFADALCNYADRSVQWALGLKTFIIILTDTLRPCLW